MKGTGRADRYEAIKRLSLILFAVGAVLALLIGNVYMVPILGIGFSLIPIWYLRSTATSYKKHLNEELETAISIITTSYLRSDWHWMRVPHHSWKTRLGIFIFRLLIALVMLALISSAS